MKFGDVGAQVLALGVAALTLIDAVDGGAGWSGYVIASLMVTVLACALLTARRRHPLAVAVALVPIAAITECAGGAVLVAVFTVAALTTWRTSLWVSVTHLLAAIPVTVVTYDTALGVVGGNLFGAALLALALAWGTAVRTRRELIESLRERAERAEAEAELEADRSRWQERERIAREMHDVLAHRISLISLHAGALEVGAEDVTATAGTIRSAAHDALEDLREILGVLRSDSGFPVRPAQGLEGVTELAEESVHAGAAVTLTVCNLEGLDPSNSRAAYRITQEALTNARKHAPGREITLAIERIDDGLHLSVVNPVDGGAATSAGPGSRSGLIGIAERVRLAGGSVDHGIVVRDGARVFALEVWLPWAR